MWVQEGTDRVAYASSLIFCSCARCSDDFWSELGCTALRSQIEYSDDEDALICFACVSKIEEFYQYREQCRTNDVLQRNWKRRLARSIEPAPSTLIPVDSIKQEKTADLDSFYDSTVQYGDQELDDTGEFQSTGGLHVLDSSEPHATTSYEVSLWDFFSFFNSPVFHGLYTESVASS